MSIPELIPPKPLQGKYDKRFKRNRRESVNKPGPKPLYLKHLGRTSAAKTLKAFAAIASLEQIYAHLVEQNDWKSAAQLYLNVENRLMGKPYTAENPEAKQKANVFNTDNRLQMYVQQLLPSKDGKAKSLKRKQVKALASDNKHSVNVAEEAPAGPIQAAAKPGGGQ